MSKRRIRRGLDETALLFAALGDATRLALIQRLSGGGPASIRALAAHFPVSRQAITKHLRILAGAGIVAGSRAGREHVWTLSAARLAEAREALSRIAQDWDEALVRLKRHVEQS